MWRYPGRLVLAVALAVAGYMLLYRPLQLRWGATQEEVRRAMPGDEIQSNPVFNATRAITIQARPEQIWPWLLQMGYKRAGWYGYDWIDNDGIPSSVDILPQWQRLNAGDSIPIWRNLDFFVVLLQTNQFLVFASKSKNDSMALGLYPVDATRTRLAWRTHLGPYNWKSPWIAAQLFTDLGDFLAVRQNLLGIKARAEGRKPPAPRLVYTELVFWLASFLAFLVAEFALAFRRNLLRPFLAAATTGLLTIWSVMLRPPLWINCLAVFAAWALVWWAVWGQEGATPASEQGNN